MGLKYYFLSDAHLGSRLKGRDEREDKLVRFCARISGAEALFLVGDIFDFWFEYRHAVPSAHFNALHALRKLASSGTSVHYIRGNHDFWRGTFLTDNIGIELVSGTATYKLSGKRVRIRHGDGFLGKSNGYSLFRAVVFNPVNNFLYRLIHPDLGVPLAGWVSGLSRAHVEKTLDLEKVQLDYREAAARDLETADCDALIMGHTHKADLLEQRGKVYANTGNWLTDFDYLLLEDGKFTLHQFKGANE